MFTFVLQWDFVVTLSMVGVNNTWIWALKNTFKKLIC